MAESVVERHTAHADCELTSRRHRISRVNGEVHYDLLELSAVGVHDHVFRGELGPKPDVLTDEA
jgi:hypothetical protein